MTVARRTALAVATALLLAPPVAAAQSPATAATPAPATRDTAAWNIDRSHSELTFSIRHLVSRVRGQFNRWTGTITGDLDNWEAASVLVTIDGSSIDTNNENRDADLRGPDFFDVANHPNLTFRSTRIERDGERVRLTGDLTIRGVTRPIVLEGSFNGTTRDQRGRTRAGFEVSGTINRKDYGIVWNRAVEAGG
ncbi:MAG TPA: YceI family protein, partial [Gemmatimonadaceae bacterium]